MCEENLEEPLEKPILISYFISFISFSEKFLYFFIDRKLELYNST